MDDTKDPTDPADPADPADMDQRFGQLVYETFCAYGRRDALTNRMGYADIQALKSASRAETIELCRGSDQRFLAILEVATPGEVATYLCGQMDGRDQGRGEIVFLASFM